MLILASASPRRRDLLTQAGIAFELRPAHINEDPRPAEPAAAYVERLAREKAEAVFLAAPAQPGLCVLGADTTVVIDEEILGKPVDAADAARMLRRLSGRTHSVLTGVALATARGTESFVDATLVTMHPLTEQQIADYIATQEPLDKAGAYAIQGGAAQFIARLEGDYNNVVGLPLARVTALLAKFSG
jgi:septum formation protein